MHSVIHISYLRDIKRGVQSPPPPPHTPPDPVTSLYFTRYIIFNLIFYLRHLKLHIFHDF